MIKKKRGVNMLTQFHESAQKAIVIAESLAFDLGHNNVGSEHMLLSFLKMKDCLFAKLLREYNVDDVVIYDDMDLDLGKVRIRKNGSSGGHNGIKSIIAHLNTDVFKRIRIGIGHKPADAIDYVLGCFSKADQNVLNEVFDKAPNMIDDLIYKGIDYIMNHYNG